MGGQRFSGGPSQSIRIKCVSLFDTGSLRPRARKLMNNLTILWENM